MSSNTSQYTAIWLSEVDYTFVREFSKKLLHPLAKKGQKFVIFCHHPRTVTFGRNMAEDEIVYVKNCFKGQNLTPHFLQTDRGGKATFHDPNQLMIYPVVSLKILGLGVKAFINKALEAIINVFLQQNILLHVDKDVQGIWYGEKKIASIGFRISEGISDHGISLYYGQVAKEFNIFNPCGHENLEFISVSELKQRRFEKQEIIKAIIDNFNSIYL
jgi:lipoyl(octanoyl) transferase